MPVRSCSKMLERRRRIGEKTLVVGIDIGCRFDAVVLMNKDGEIYKKYPKIYNSSIGFKFYRGRIEKIKKEKGLKEVIIGLEPTGHYWRKIAYYSIGLGYEVRFIRTTSVKHQRELDESSSDKCDIRDAITLGNLVREGKYLDSQMPQGVYRQLRTLGKVRARMLRYNTGTKHALKAVIEDYFPELKEIFWSMSAKGLWGLLEECPFPDDVLKKEVEEIAGIIGKKSRRKAEALNKAKKVCELAKESIGLKDIGIADRLRVKMYLKELKRTEDDLKEIKDEMEKLLRQVPESKYMLSIPGVGMLTTAVFFGEIGDLGNFNNYREVVKYAGYDPVRKDSGMRVGGRWISKKGRYLLRKFIYFMSMRVVQRSNYFKCYYETKKGAKDRNGEGLRKKEALCAVAIKLIKIIFTLITEERKFTEAPPRISVLAA